MARLPKQVAILSAGVVTNLLVPISQAQGFGVDVQFQNTHNLGNAARWDSVPFTYNKLSRSLSGGLTVGFDGGSIETFRQSFTASDWQDGKLPSKSDFETTVKAAFNAWQPAIHPTAAPIAFKYVDTPIEKNNLTGNSIDVYRMDLDNNDMASGYTEVWTVNRNVTLTSGTKNYSSQTNVGTDIRIDTDRNGLKWDLDSFRLTLTHEVGHALGIGHPDDGALKGYFWDNDNIINNAMIINGADPMKGLSNFKYSEDECLNEHFLMASIPIGVNFTNDDKAARAFFYPIPEPSMVFLAVGLLGVIRIACRKAADR